jgi:hypothetical protein
MMLVPVLLLPLLTVLTVLTVFPLATLKPVVRASIRFLSD